MSDKPKWEDLSTEERDKLVMGEIGHPEWILIEPATAMTIMMAHMIRQGWTIHFEKTGSSRFFIAIIGVGKDGAVTAIDDDLIYGTFHAMALAFGLVSS